jgi:DNA-binding GntR family transcriptional regulator
MAERIPQSEIAYHYISERIQRRQILPGDLLSENSLARECKMSRTPVREAIRRLAQEGALVVLPNRGVVVARLTMEDLDEIYGVREVLEGLAARLAAQRISEAGLARLRELLDGMERALGAGEHSQFSRLDMEFHGEVAKQARNKRLMALLDTMRTANAAAYFSPSLQERNPRGRTSLSEHRSIYEAIAAHDAETAERRTRDHARLAVRDALMLAFAGGEGGEDDSAAESVAATQS